MRAAAAFGWTRRFVAFAVVAAVSLPAGARATTAACEPDPAWATPALDKTAEMFSLVNAHRSSLGLPTLLFSPTLGDSASWKSMHMAGYGYLTHDDPGPPTTRSWEDRVRDCGYSGLGGENISMGSDPALDTFQRWLASAGHRENIEDPAFTVIGIGVARSATGTHYWVQNFGREIDAGASLVAPLPSLDEGTTSDPPPAGDGTEAGNGTQPGDGDEAGDGTGPGDGDGAGNEAADGTEATAPGGTQPDATANREPNALMDSTRARRKRWVKITVLRNDSDPDGDALAIEAITVRPSKGRARIDETGTFIQYRARRGAGQRTRLAYSVVDNRGGSATAVVRIKITR